MPTSGSGRTVWILGRGIREIDQQVLYSAAWLDDPRSDSGRIMWIRSLEPAPPPRAAVDNRPAPQPTDAPTLGLPTTWACRPADRRCRPEAGLARRTRAPDPASVRAQLDRPRALAKLELTLSVRAAQGQSRA